MKVILLFDSDKMENVYREYYLDDDTDDKLRAGQMCKISFCHPDHGEQLMAKTCEMLSEESLT